jgi:ATP-dependent Lon protease
VILPKRNEPDLEDVPAEVKESMKFIFAESMDDVLNAALQKADSKKKSRGVKTAKTKSRTKKALAHGKKGTARRR